MMNKKAIGALANIRFKGCEEIEEQIFAFGTYDEETDTEVIDYELIFGSSNENEK